MHVVRPPRETGLACDAPNMSALSINLGEQYDTEVARGPSETRSPPVTVRKRWSVRNRPGRTQPDHHEGGHTLGQATSRDGSPR
jgi:hypothetical protein